MGSEESRTKSRGQRVQTGSSWGELDLLFEFICFRDIFLAQTGVSCPEGSWRFAHRKVSSAGLEVPNLFQNVV